MVLDNARGLPSGNVTFLFTDIEGSTKILKRLPGAATSIFDRHNEIIRSALRAHRGHEVGTDGDAFFAAFDSADDALATCASAQRALADERWPEGGTVRVRMGVHSGVAAPHRDNYLALAVHQASRVVAAAHGGQTIVSNTALIALNHPPPGQLVALGRFRVRDFDEPEVLHRFDPPDVPIVDRSLRATPAGGHNLVRPPTSFVGREHAAGEVSALLSADRVLTLVGPGGTGKTRLAIEVGLRCASDWPDGVWLIELADLTDSSLVPATIADALGLATPGSDGWADVLSWARDSRSLLIVDNIEAHLAISARLLSDLLQYPGIAVMTTSIEPLKIAGEVVYRVGALDLPSPDDDLAALLRSPSVELFVDRANAMRPDFVLDESTAPDLAQLCNRLDGLPLAIEIAAARIGVLGVSEILAGLDNRFGLLRSNERTRPARHRTMSDVLSWSYELLSPAEQIAFRRLAVFGETFTVDSAVAALADDDLSPDTVPELVWALVDKSLLVADLTKSGTRYRLPESVGDFAEGLLAQHGDGPETARRSATELLERVGPWMMADRRWIGEVAVELANIRALVVRLRVEDQELAQELVCSLGRYHDAVQSFEMGIDELTQASIDLDAKTSTRVALLTALADLRLRHADISKAASLLEAAAELQREVGAPEWNDAAVERTRGEMFCRAGSYGDAVAIAEAALGRGLSLLGQARMWNLDGIARYAMGDMTGGFDAFRRELDIYTELGFEANIASAQGNLAELAMRLGDAHNAAVHQQACLDLALAIGQPVMCAYSSLVAARLAADVGDWTLAVRLQSAAEAELSAAGHTLYDADRAVLDELRSAAITNLGAEEVASKEDAGSQLGAVDAAALATEVFTAVRSSSPDQRP